MMSYSEEQGERFEMLVDRLWLFGYVVTAEPITGAENVFLDS